MSEEYDNLSIEELLTDVDVLGKPGVYWTIVGTLMLVSLSVVTAVWRLAYRIKKP